MPYQVCWKIADCPVPEMMGVVVPAAKEGTGVAVMSSNCGISAGV